ncbi:GMC oxidoreductase [Marinomonas sp. MED121]|uniref:GMC oxidoreductase n=1 Tax=Marinomonas sp. MED121 TaxID=314277 RepID=UPI00031B3CAC|nr:GMC oxidoreductase [Marinomonas sp. MED121]
MGNFASTENLHHGYPTPGPQSPSGQNVMDHVFFLTEGQWKNARENGQYDLVIIGTGFCAYATAERALENDPHCRILMLERGPFFLPEHFQNLPLPFVNTLGGLSETFPWTLSQETASGRGGPVRWQHGMVPFVGGRSTLWSAWCPRPNTDEMKGWPKTTIATAKEYFASAEKLLRVQNADQIDANRDPLLTRLIGQQRPVYGELQNKVQTLLNNANETGSIPGVYRTQAAPLACDGKEVDDIDFQKYSTPGPLLELVSKQQALAKEGKGSTLDIVTQCVVERIYNQDGTASALQTSRGVMPINGAKLILAMGTLPPTTLVQNSFPELQHIGERFSAHFISAITARVPKADLGLCSDNPLEMGACYVAGIGNNYDQQFHIQLTSISNQDPVKNAGTALRYMPDVVSTASMAQLESSEDYVVFVCAVLGELDYDNKENWFKHYQQDSNITTNSLLQVVENSSDYETWNAMDKATFSVLEDVLSPQGKSQVQYWHGDPDSGEWASSQPSTEERRVDALVHESSTLFLGEHDDAPVDTDYKLRGTNNVYITGGCLWPQGGSWNPTMTMVALAQHLADNLIKK